MDATEIRIRHIHQEDIDELVACEIKSHEYIDPDFGVPQLPPYTWRADDIMEAIRSYRSTEEGTYDTRTVVAEVDLSVLGDDGEEYPSSWIVGGMIFQIVPDAYEILLLTAHPAGPKNVRDELLQKIIDRAAKSPSRRIVRMTVPDGDYKTLAFLKRKGFSSSLHRTEPFDMWLCELGAKSRRT